MWQPIETAPKDGTSILLTGDPKQIVYVGYWYSQHPNIPTSIKVDTGWALGLSFISWLPELWVKNSTHWMPLPEPPQESQTLNSVKEVNNRFISKCCQGELCSVCGRPAQHKLEETIFHDDPVQMRHPLTAYVCHAHFLEVVGPAGGQE